MSILQRGISHSLLKSRISQSQHAYLAVRRYASTSTSSGRSSWRAGAYATVFTVSAGIFVVYYFDARSAMHRYILTPVLRNLFDAETGHKIAVKVLRTGFGPKDPVADDARLKFKLWGEDLSNPIGVAAGFDKDGEAIDGLYDLGFSWVEIGSVTPKPQPGNPRPRVFRLPEDDALINRYGFPSQGHSTVLSRLLARIPRFTAGAERAALRDGSMLAVNLGKNKESPADSIDDYITGVRTFGPYTDVLVVNVSSPNTPGLRGLQNKDILQKLLHAVSQARNELEPSSLTARRPKLVLKIAPDLNESQLTDIADVVKNSSIDGVIVSNTTIQRPSHLRNPSKIETGGLSGVPIKPISLKALQTLRSLLPASIPIIGSGGIRTGQDALDFAKAGAQMVQVYTSFGYNGVGTCRRIKDELTELLVKEGKTWDEIVKEAVVKHSWKEPEPKPSTMNQLVTEAEELKSFLGLGEKQENVEGGREALPSPSPQEIKENKTGGEAEMGSAAQASVL
ncbi:Dihydroorotate dehydrogenase (quinone), mitochondrial [Leucoagaricus sp. SymC.cos]|nr:Dihydroorotate dehydrogenase (quinone), mitochondrial [Leucoagaricus sp. SymC.cos]